MGQDWRGYCNFVAMKSPFRHIAVLVAVALLALLAYQGYWLASLYGTMRSHTDSQIDEAMRMADVKELFMRIRDLKASDLGLPDKSHGDLSVSAFVADAKGVSVKSNITEYPDDATDSVVQREVTMRGYPQTGILPEQTTTSQLETMLLFDSLTLHLREGLHVSVDAFVQSDVQRVDSLLTQELRAIGLSGEHHLQCVRDDTTLTLQTPGYESHGSNRNYEYVSSAACTYYLTVPSTAGLVLRQMWGIVATSLALVALVGLAFAWLVRIIMRQRTLDEMKSDFTNNITHELKTPIAVAYAANDALLNFDDNVDASRRRQYLTVAQQQLTRLSGMVEQILSLSMERRKTFGLKLETVRLADVLAPVIEQQQLKAGRPVSITVDIDPPELTLQADRTHLSNMLNNLLDNAIKYTPDGNADDSVVCVEVQARADGIISITDHGIGIAADKLPHVFDKFYRVPTGDRHDVPGYGLGLFYVKTMADRHGWRVTVTSQPGQGSTFTLITQDGRQQSDKD